MVTLSNPRYSKQGNPCISPILGTQNMLLLVMDRVTPPMTDRVVKKYLIYSKSLKLPSSGLVEFCVSEETAPGVFSCFYKIFTPAKKDFFLLFAIHIRRQF